MSKLISLINFLLLIVLVIGCSTTMPTTPLIDATHQKNSKTIELLLNKGADINGIGGKNGETPLMVASRKGSFDIVRLLVDEGADINASGAYGDTALLAAAWTCQNEIAKYLIKNGARVNAKNVNYGSTALNIVAGECKNKDFIRLLLDNGADIHIKNNGGDSPLFSAIKNRQPSIVNMLLDSGANINEKNGSFTALMIAVLRGNEDVVSILINKKIDINAKNRFGDTALDIAKEYKKSNIVGLLKQAGAKEKPKKGFGLEPVSFPPLGPHKIN